jgi:hypothetical protein
MIREARGSGVVELQRERERDRNMVAREFFLLLLSRFSEQLQGVELGGNYHTSLQKGAALLETRAGAWATTRLCFVEC